MSLLGLLSQSQAARCFHGLLPSGPLAHAYIFYGPEGVGKALFARELSKTLFCEKGGKEACNHCPHCRQVEGGNHPDFYWIAPEPGDKFIRIEAIRAMERYAALKPSEARRKVFVIQQADRMNEEASNCLLKTLEEPPPGVVILLIATSLQLLRKTIVSRCQLVRFHPLPLKVVEKLLEEKFGLKGEEMEWLARASCGSLGRAERLKEEAAFARKKGLIARLSSLRPEDNFSLSQELLVWCPDTDQGLEERRACLRNWLGIILEYYRDVLLCNVGAPGLFNKDAEAALQAKARVLPAEAVIRIMNEISEALEALQYNANIPLVLEDMFSRIARLESKG